MVLHSIWRRKMEGSNERFKRICVFCGSSSGNKTVFSDAALDLGKELVERRIDLVYGGGSVGLMGLISQTVYNGGCHVLGVIPTALMPLEISGQTVGEVKTVTDMHERKAEMARQADAFIALPGGYGTMEELLEMITWSQLGIHDKPVLIHHSLMNLLQPKANALPFDVLKNWCRRRIYKACCTAYCCICSHSKGTDTQDGGICAYA